MGTQEYFACDNKPEKVEEILVASGFERGRTEHEFVYKDVFVSVGSYGELLKKERIPYETQFGLDFKRELKDIPQNDPLLKFFKKIRKPIALGIPGVIEPKYGIKEYLK
jgi:hypothetical protein